MSVAGLHVQAQGTARSKRTVQGASRRAPTRMTSIRWWLWLNRALILFGVAVVIWVAGLGVHKLRAIPVETIVVEGRLEYTRPEALQNMVQPALVGGFLSADLAKVQAQLEALPWIYTANVRRRWPSTLEIHVVEQLPIARWGEEGLLNHEGQVFRSDKAAERGDLPLLSGADADAGELIARYHRVVAALRPLDLGVLSLHMDERGQLEAGLSGGIRLMLGNTEFYRRVERFIAVYQSDLAARADEVVRVDMRYQSGLAVAFKEPSQVAGI